MSWYQSFEYCLNERPFVMRSIFNYLYKQRKIRSIHSLRSVQLSVQSLEERAVPATFIVTSNGDNGAGTFREALSLSNGSPGADIIRFNIGTGQQSIALASALPDVSDAVTIDATTQPGYSGSPIIELNGANAGGSATGLKVTSGLVAIKGLIINRFSNQGIWLYGGGSNTIKNCWIGLNSSGSAAAANSSDGIFIDKSSGNTVGGPLESDRNLISGNSGNGIHFLFNGQANNNLMQNNYIGTDVTGKYAVGNSGNGIDFFGPATYNTMINNIISGNSGHGITFFGGDASDNLITSNHIGVDVTGTRGIPNNRNGVDIWGPPRITVTNNVIASNKGSGVVINSESIVVQGNFIGTDRTRTYNLGNLDYGVVIGGLSNPKDTRIGGPNPSDGNVIANNGASANRPGVSVTSGAKGVLIFNNSIYDNYSLGIDLNGDGKPNINDLDDPDTGGNNLLNFPVITNAIGGTGKVNLVGTYNGLPSTILTLQFFTSTASDSSGYGEGRDILGTKQITTDSSGNYNFNFSFSSSIVAIGSKISATASVSGNGIGSGYTSEFSQTATVTAAPSADLAITASTSSGAMIGSNYNYSFRVVNNGPNTVSLASVDVPLPSGISYVSSSAQASVSGNNIVTLEIGNLASGASTDLSMTVLPSIFGPIATTATVGGLNTDNNPSNNSVLTTVPVKDKPGSFQFDFSSLQVGEWESVATIHVNRVGGSGGAASVNYAVSGKSATTGTDFISSANGVLNFADAQSSATFTITIANDLLHEGNESLSLALLNPTGSATLGSPAIATLSIIDDDAVPSFSINDITQPEGTGANQSVTFTVTMSAPSGLAASVNYATLTGTATSPADFTGSAGILVFTPGETSRTITIPITGDSQQENDELFYVDLSSPTESSISDSRGIATLLNDDAAPSISVADSSITEGTGSVVQMNFTVILSVASGLPVKVNYATLLGSAVSPVDFSNTSGQLSFLAGETQKTVKVTIQGDSIFEVDEQFFFNLNTPVNSTIERGSAVGTIFDNDPMPSLSIENLSLTEPDSGSLSNATFLIKLSSASGSPVTVQVDTADITAKAGIDYSATSQILTFAPGATSKTFVVPVIGDRLFEQTENFAVNLSNATGASVSSNFGVGAILDNDPQIFLSVSDATVIEGDSGTSDAIFQVTLSAPCEAAVTVNYATADHTATSGTDYSATSGMLTIPAGQTTGVIRVPVLGDHQAEPYEKFFFLNLSSPAYASLTKTSATATIRDQDSPGTFAFDQASYSVNENAGSKTVVLTVVRTNGGTGAVIIPYTVLSVTATAGQDFQSTSGTVNFADGQISSTISVAIINDSLVETPETFSVTLGTPSISAASLGAIKTTTVTIISEDTAPPPPRINSISTVISKGSMTGINITFSTALDPNTIKNLASYVLSAAGKDKKFGTKDDTKYRITKVAYNATSRTLTLTHSAIRLTADLQLTIIGTGSTALKDTIGQALDGDKNATPGGNAMVMISKTGRATF
jgi:uncharacterized repeat protein (TIGR01451 family)